MRVRLKTLYAGPAGIYQPGAVVPFQDSEAEALVSAGYASREDPIVQPRIEAAVIATAPENAQIERAPDVAAPRNTNRARPAKRLSP
jgi:hypothetical protein